MLLLKFLIITFLVTFSYANKPELFLLKNYAKDKNVTSWYMSEKLDGVRAYWDGKKMISRSGKVFATPTFFLKDFPKHKLDGELWIKRESFSKVVSIVNKKKPHEGWKNITYNIFEVPDAVGGLSERLAQIKESEFIKVIPQIKVKDKKSLDEFLKTVEAKGGEGIVVRDGSLPYYTGRHDYALKIKSYIDTECEVLSHINGEGKYENMLGSFTCKMKDNKVIKIGSGLNNEQRKIFHPRIGAIITFKYYGLTSKGNPRFPIFLRIRE